jgi:hypothetical protein
MAIRVNNFTARPIEVDGMKIRSISGRLRWRGQRYASGCDRTALVRGLEPWTLAMRITRKWTALPTRSLAAVIIANVTENGPEPKGRHELFQAGAVGLRICVTPVESVWASGGYLCATCNDFLDNDKMREVLDFSWWAVQDLNL